MDYLISGNFGGKFIIQTPGALGNGYPGVWNFTDHVILAIFKRESRVID